MKSFKVGVLAAILVAALATVLAKGQRPKWGGQRLHSMDVKGTLGAEVTVRRRSVTRAASRRSKDRWWRQIYLRICVREYTPFILFADLIDKQAPYEGPVQSFKAVKTRK